METVHTAQRIEDEGEIGFETPSSETKCYQVSEVQRSGVQRDNLAKSDCATMGNTIQELTLKSVKLNYRKTHQKKRCITQS